MSKVKRVTIVGTELPKFVSLTGNKTDLFAGINLDLFTGTAFDLGNAISKLGELGFKYEGTEYETGYYNSVKDITLDFRFYNHNLAIEYPENIPT